MQQQADATGALDWQVHYVDSTTARASARRRCQGGPDAEALGRSRGGFSTKIHLRVEGGGKPFTFVLTPGQAHEAPHLLTLLNQGAVKRKGPDRPKPRPHRIVADKGYTGQPNRALLRRRGIRFTIPRRSNERRPGTFDRVLYLQCNRIERLINRLKQFRRIATRYEKRAENYLAILTIAAILLWL